MDSDREARIRDRAYEIWVREGRPQGRQDEHWRQAEAEIAAEMDAASGPKAAGGKPGSEPAAAEEERPASGPPRSSRRVTGSASAQRERKSTKT